MDIRSPADLGRFVRLERVKLGLSQSDLAARVGVSRNWLSALEGGKSGAELGLALAVLRALGAGLAAASGQSQPTPGPSGTSLVAAGTATASGAARVSFVEAAGAAVGGPPNQPIDSDFPTGDDALLDALSARPGTPR